jgi:acylphosphatase
MKDAKAKILVSGRVQGVFFRHSTRERARFFKISGWVKNQDDGSVEIYARAPKEALEKLIEWCHNGPPNARVEVVHVEWLDDEENEGQSFGIASGGASGGESRFEIR